MNFKRNQKRILSFLLSLVLCVNLAGCSTLGSASAGFVGMLTTVVLLPFKVAEQAINIVNKLPMPPPGVF